MAKISNGEALGQRLSDIFFGFLKDPSSKLVRGTAFQKIGPFVGAFKNGANIDDKIIQFYITTIANSKNKDVCYHASFNFPAFIFVFGPEKWPRFQQIYQKVANFNDTRIKITLSASLHELAKILGQKYTEEDLLPCLDTFLSDPHPDIRIKALENIHKILEVISPEQRELFIPHIVLN